MLTIYGFAIDGDPARFNDKGKAYFLEAATYIKNKSADGEKSRTHGLEHIHDDLATNGFDAEFTTSIKKHMRSMIMSTHANVEFIKATKEIKNVLKADVCKRRTAWKAWRKKGGLALGKKITEQLNKEKQNKPINMHPDKTMTIASCYQANKEVPFDNDRRTIFKAGFYAFMWFASLNLHIDPEAFEKTYMQQK